MQFGKRFGKTVAYFIIVASIFCTQGCSMGKPGDNSPQEKDRPYWQAIVGWARKLVNKPTFTYDMNSLFEKENVIPLAIIGSGPAGLGAAIYGARDNTETLVIEGNNPGGLLMYTTDVENWGESSKITGPEIMKRLRNRAEEVGTHFLSDVVESVDFKQWPFVLTMESGKKIYALAVALTTGASPKELGVLGEREYKGYGVTSCAVCDAGFYPGKDVVVVGGGDSAIESAIQLVQHVKSVTILVRGEKMRAVASMQDRLKQYPNIHVMYNVQVKRIVGTEDDQRHVTEVELLNTKTKEVTSFPAEGVFVTIGHEPNSRLFKGQVDLDEHGYVKTMNGTHNTSVPGVVAAGEIEDYRYRQAWSSGGRGTEAALDALAHLRSIGFTPEIAQKLKDSGALWQPETEVYDMPSMVHKKELEQETAASDLPVLLDFWAEDCPNCVSMLPTVSRVAQKMQGKAKFFKVDAAGELDTVSDLVPYFHITKIPTLIVVKQGKEVARHVGPMTRKELEAFIAQALAQ